MAEERRIRVLMAKPGLDGHDRGARVLTLGLRDEGMEVIYTGLRQTPDKIAQAAIQEDVDVVGLSCLSGAHRYLFPEVVERLRERGAQDVMVIGGGIIAKEDIPFLKEKGIDAIFGPGTPVKEIANYIKENVKRK
ncbi:MAG: cobalamin B12-binding domain-containing protein [Dehalococcoidia bacterium]|nr:MAG: cobalamin B12-binding domain-containing protein [Dehalococcoidia bacterium]